MKKKQKIKTLQYSPVFHFPWFDNTIHLLLYVCKCNVSGKSLSNIYEEPLFCLQSGFEILLVSFLCKISNFLVVFMI